MTECGPAGCERKTLFECGIAACVKVEEVTNDAGKKTIVLSKSEMEPHEWEALEKAIKEEKL
ncbi:MAG: hypothetical protein V1845_02015 [bacterium]